MQRKRKDVADDDPANDIEELKPGLVIFTGFSVGVAARTKDGKALRLKFRVATAYLKRTQNGTKLKQTRKKTKKNLEDSECEEGGSDEDTMEEEEDGNDNKQKSGKRFKKDPAFVVESEKKKSTSSIVEPKKIEEKFKDFIIVGADCDAIKSPFLKVTLKLDTVEEGKATVYVLKSIEKIEPARKITVALLKSKARASHMFDPSQSPGVRKALINSIFDVLGPPDQEITESETFRALLVDAKHKDVFDFCHNVLRDERTYTTGIAVGWHLVNIMDDDEVAILFSKDKEQDARLHLIRTILCRKTADHRNALFDTRAVETFGFGTKKLGEALHWLSRANDVIRQLQFGEQLRFDSCLKAAIGTGKYQIEPETLEELTHFETDQKQIVIDRDFEQKVTIKLKETYESELVFCQAFAAVPAVHLVDVECDTNFDNSDRESYMSKLQQIEASSPKTIWFTTKRRMYYLKSKIGTNTNLLDFDEQFPSSSEKTVKFSIEKMKTLKHLTSTCVIIVEQCHRLSLKEMGFFFRVVTAAWHDLRVSQLVLCGNSYCYPESVGHPFTDLVKTFPHANTLTILRSFEKHQRTPAFFFDDVDELKAKLKTDCRNQTFDVVSVDEPQLKQLKDEMRSLQNTIDFLPYSSLRYTRSCNTFMVLDVRSIENLSMTQLQKALACAPIKQSNLFVLGSRLNYQQVLGDVTTKKGNSRFTDINFMLLLARQEYERNRNITRHLQ